MKALRSFLNFDLAAFLDGKRLAFLKAEPWRENEVTLGSKVMLQIIADETAYAKEGVSNFGEQFALKTRGVDPIAYAKWKPFSEVTITEVERATVYGEYQNNLSIIGQVALKTDK